MIENKTTLRLNPQGASVAKDPLDFNVKNLTPELFDKTAENWAKRIAFESDENGNILKDSRGTERLSKNMPTQLRRFYDELVMWDERGAKPNSDFNSILPFVYMMKSKVAYARGRGNVDKTFQNFINKMIGQITDQKTLNNAKLFMEAMMGFYKQYRPTK